MYGGSPGNRTLLPFGTAYQAVGFYQLRSRSVLKSATTEIRTRNSHDSGVRRCQLGYRGMLQVVRTPGFEPGTFRV